jgi:hypothetical protein
VHRENKKMEMGIIYQDRTQRTVAVWRIVQRNSTLLWAQTVAIDSEQVFLRT